jgi:non-canonical (house-cleaning) NTP pyrophosphatase
MKVGVGSTNPTKVEAVREALNESNFFKDFEIILVEVD